MVSVKNLRVKYIYNFTQNVRRNRNGLLEVFVTKSPVACVVSDGISFGVSVCNKNDSFSKERSKQIAVGRMLSGFDQKPHTRTIRNNFLKKVSLQSEIDFWVNHFMNA